MLAVQYSSCYISKQEAFQAPTNICTCNNWLAVHPRYKSEVTSLYCRQVGLPHKHSFIQVRHTTWLSFTRPSPTLVLQATNAGARRPGYEATCTVQHAQITSCHLDGGMIENSYGAPVYSSLMPSLRKNPSGNIAHYTYSNFHTFRQEFECANRNTAFFNHYNSEPVFDRKSVSAKTRPPGMDCFCQPRVTKWIDLV